MGPLHILQVRNRVPPLKVTVELDSHPVAMEVDTGAAYSLVSESTYREIWPDKRLDKCDMRLCTYSDESMEVLGSLTVAVIYQCLEFQEPS